MKDHDPQTKTPTVEQGLRHRKLTRGFGTAALIAVSAELLVAPVGLTIRTAQEAPTNLSPFDIAIATKDRLSYAINDTLQANPCPVAPDNIDALSGVAWQHAPLTTHEEVVAYGENKGLSFPETSTVDEAETAISKAMSIDQINTILDSFSSAQLGIPIKAKDLDKYPADMPSLETYKTSSTEFLNIVTLMPKELLDKIGLTSIIIQPLVQESQRPNGDIIIGQYDPIYKFVTLDVNNISNPNTIFHEVVGHAVQYTVCHGYTLNDAAIQNQNPKDQPYLEDSLHEKDYDYTVWGSAYAQSSVEEDNAETTAKFLLNTIPIEIDSTHDPVTKKMSIIKDRLDKLVPNLTDYFIGVSPYIRNLASID